MCVSINTHSVPALEAYLLCAVPCPYCLAPYPNSLAPCPIYSAIPEYIYINCLLIIAIMNHKLLRAGLCLNFGRSCVKGLGHSRSKLWPIMCRLHAKLCPNRGRLRARLCPIYFAPCPFPNLAGTLHAVIG